MSCTFHISLTVNGRRIQSAVEPRLLLADFLREDLHLTGTHVGCEQGICGACTVLMNGSSIRSCLTFAVQCEGSEITTVEGLAQDGTLADIQQAFREHHALQCGFCTPGMLMTTVELVQRNAPASPDEIRHALSGNLCRCTGYQSIVDAVNALLPPRSADAGGRRDREPDSDA